MKKILSMVLCLLFLLPGVRCFAEPTPQPDSDPESNANIVVDRAVQELGEPDAAAIDTYLYLDSIEGESKNADHDKWIDAIYCYPSSEHPERGVLSETFTLKHIVDKATSQIQEHHMKGTKIDTGEVHYCRQAGGQQEVVYAIKLEGITVTKEEVTVEDFSDGTFQLVETVEMKVDRTTRIANVPLSEEPDSTVIEAEEPQNKNAGLMGSNRSPETGITETKAELLIALACIGAALIGLIVVCVRKKKTEDNGK